MALSVAQCRAARALLGWSMADLADAAGTSVITVKRFEGGEPLRPTSVERLSDALINAGIDFIAAGESSPDGGEGVRLTSPSFGA
ncbi:multiprotein-bridging factor 1 family protein [Sphingomonas floccifaciens]|uniref:Multiprotein-bridging factor 1 family protein n=1 Tax=Sphingomonas floccifaciens TaxID=1844115 RepID=A0ABW4NM26_9SPHN